MNQGLTDKAAKRLTVFGHDVTTGKPVVQASVPPPEWDEKLVSAVVMAVPLVLPFVGPLAELGLLGEALQSEALESALPDLIEARNIQTASELDQSALAAERSRFYVQVKGQETITLADTDLDAARFRASYKIQRELSQTNYRNGKVSLNVGKANSVPVGIGPNVSETLHTHPSGVALFSQGDAFKLFLKNGVPQYSADAKHMVLGFKYPNLNAVLESYGDPIVDTVVKTEIKQSMLQSGNITYQPVRLGR